MRPHDPLRYFFPTVITNVGLNSWDNNPEQECDSERDKHSRCYLYHVILGIRRNTANNDNLCVSLLKLQKLKRRLKENLCKRPDGNRFIKAWINIIIRLWLNRALNWQFSHLRAQIRHFYLLLDSQQVKQIARSLCADVKDFQKRNVIGQAYLAIPRECRSQSEHI